MSVALKKSCSTTPQSFLLQNLLIKITMFAKGAITSEIPDLVSKGSLLLFMTTGVNLVKLFTLTGKVYSQISLGTLLIKLYNQYIYFLSLS